MILYSNDNDKYIFFTGYDVEGWKVFYPIATDLTKYYNTYNSFEINNDELLDKVITAVLNQNTIIVKNINLGLIPNNIKHIVISDNNEISIKPVNIIHLRFYISDTGDYYKVEYVYDDNKNLTIEEYKHIFEITSNSFEIYDKIAEALNNGKYVYLPKKLLEHIELNDILVVDKNMKLLFNVKDDGNYYEVTGINDNEMLVLGSVNSTYEVFSWAVYEAICEAYTDGKKIYLPKSLNSQLSLSDVIIKDYSNDELELAKHMARIEARDLIYSTRFDKLAIVDNYEYITLIIYFANLGFFITDLNREEKYIELINYVSELEDENKSEEIISKFERYLILIDKTKIYPSYTTAIETFNDSIDNCSSVDEVNSILNSFKDKWK